MNETYITSSVLKMQKNDMKRQWSTIKEILHKQTNKTTFPEHFVIDSK